MCCKLQFKLAYRLIKFYSQNSANYIPRDYTLLSGLFFFTLIKEIPLSTLC